jgi:hypothetical protein
MLLAVLLPAVRECGLEKEFNIRKLAGREGGGIYRSLFIECVRLETSEWPRGLRRGSAAERFLGSWVRIPPGAWMCVSCECLCCQVEVSATSRSPVQRSPTDCGVCLSVIK